MDLLNDVNQQLGESGEAMDEEEEEKEGEGRRCPAHSSPAHLTETSATISHIKFSTPSPNKSIVSPSKRHLVGSGYRSSIQGHLRCLCNLYIKWFLVSILIQNAN